MFTGVNMLVLSESSCWLTWPNEGTKHSDEIEALHDIGHIQRHDKAIIGHVIFLFGLVPLGLLWVICQA